MSLCLTVFHRNCERAISIVSRTRDVSITIHDNHNERIRELAFQQTISPAFSKKENEKKEKEKKRLPNGSRKISYVDNNCLLITVPRVQCEEVVF